MHTCEYSKCAPDALVSSSCTRTCLSILLVRQIAAAAWRVVLFRYIFVALRFACHFPRFSVTLRLYVAAIVSFVCFCVLLPHLLLGGHDTFSFSVFPIGWVSLVSFDFSLFHRMCTHVVSVVRSTMKGHLQMPTLAHCVIMWYLLCRGFVTR